MNAMSGLAEFAVIPATSVFPAPDGLALRDSATLGCAVLTAYGAVRHGAALQEGETVAVVGVGGVGANVVQIARALGAAEVIAVDISAEKLVAAAELGATHGVDASRDDVAERVLELTGGAGADVVFEALGRPDTVREGLRMAGLGGRIVAIGVTPAGVLTEVEMNDLVRRQLRLIGSYGARPRADMPELLRLVSEGRVRPGANITRRVRLEDAGATLEALDRGEIVGRAIVEFP
jgi:S-(hydroxymethyl)glutathione dehydrogenase/alcohol dehydrogenase